MAKDFYIFCPSGEISSNLVTLSDSEKGRERQRDGEGDGIVDETSVAKKSCLNRKKSSFLTAAAEILSSPHPDQA